MKRTLRCNAQHPSLKNVRCDSPMGHDGRHFASWANRAWHDLPEPLPWWVRAAHDQGPVRVSGGRAD